MASSIRPPRFFWGCLACFHALRRSWSLLWPSLVTGTVGCSCSVLWAPGKPGGPEAITRMGPGQAQHHLTALRGPEKRGCMRGSCFLEPLLRLLSPNTLRHLGGLLVLPNPGARSMAGQSPCFLCSAWLTELYVHTASFLCLVLLL